MDIVYRSGRMFVEFCERIVRNAGVVIIGLTYGLCVYNFIV
jgi:hypothetical protein